MKKTILIILALAFAACKSVTNSLRPEAVLNAEKTGTVSVPEITPASVGAAMNFLASDELEGRDSGTEGIEKAADYIENVFKKHGIKPYFSTYRDTLSNFESAPAYNVVGFLPGNDPALKDEFVVIGAHYDHVGFGKTVEGDSIANGANDNASGTTAVLELAKHFGATKNHKRSLMFVLFSAEERGLLGSRHLAPKLKKQGLNLYAMVNFEMIGVPMTASYKAYLTGYETSNMASKINEYAGKEVIGFLPTAKQYQLFKRSDNYPFFQEFGVPCQTICTFDFTNYDYYHHVFDEASRMDFTHMAAIINDIVPAVTRMASTPDREIKMNE